MYIDKIVVTTLLNTESQIYLFFNHMIKMAFNIFLYKRIPK